MGKSGITVSNLKFARTHTLLSKIISILTPQLFSDKRAVVL